MATPILRWLAAENRGDSLIFKHLVESLEMVEVEILVIKLYETGSVRACSAISHMGHPRIVFYKT